jgi:hypothetical protein
MCRGPEPDATPPANARGLTLWAAEHHRNSAVSIEGDRPIGADIGTGPATPCQAAPAVFKFGVHLNLGHLESDVAAMVHNLDIDFDQLLAQAGQQPRFPLRGITIGEPPPCLSPAPSARAICAFGPLSMPAGFEPLFSGGRGCHPCWLQLKLLPSGVRISERARLEVDLWIAARVPGLMFRTRRWLRLIHQTRITNWCP